MPGSGTGTPSSPPTLTLGMTFGELKQALYDKMGFTGETTLVASLVNKAKDELCAFAKWPFLRTADTISFQTGVSEYTMAQAVGAVSDVEDADGNPLTPIHWDLFQDLYRGDTGTADNPTVWAMEGGTVNGYKTISVAPLPASDTVGTLRFLARVPDMSDDAEYPQYIPPECHWIVRDLALARFAAWEDDPQAVALRQAATGELAIMAKALEADVNEPGAP